MDRIHHVKIVTTDPAAVTQFLTSVVHIPQGEMPALKASPAGSDPRPPRQQAPVADRSGSLDWDEVFRVRGPLGSQRAMLGDGTSRQFQVLEAEERSQIWSVAIGTRDLEGARERAIGLGFPVTELRLFEFEGLNVRAFFARVGGLLFEVARQEPAS